MREITVQDNNPVSPGYYNDTKIVPWDVIEDWGLGFNLGSCMKYIKRAGNKPGNSKVQDLKKVIAYVQREIEQTERGSKNDR